MIRLFTLRLWILAGFSLFLFGALPASAASVQSSCPGVLDNRGTLNVLTINILFSEYPQRSQRLDDIAAFIASNNVHIVALQEVVGGALDEFLAATLGGESVEGNTAQELQRILGSTHGVKYNLQTGFATGVPGAFNTFNAVLSRCRFVGSKLVKRLPKVSAIEILGIKIQLGQRVLMTRVAVPGFGQVNVFNAHLCSYCNASDRLTQARSAVRFIKQVQAFRPSSQVLFLGDFNTDVPSLADPLPPETAALYNLIVAKNKFIDSFADFTTRTVGPHFCDAVSDHGCTRGVSDIVDPINPDAAKERIDYIFGKGPLVIRRSTVVFNPLASDNPQPPGVSDHSAVLTKYAREP